MLSRHLRPALCIAALLFAQAAQASGKSISRRILAQGKGRIVIARSNGEVEWEFPCPYTSHDIALLPGGNLLIHLDPATVAEVNRQRQIVWQYRAEPKPGYDGAVEIHAFQRLKDGLTMVAESGNRRIVEVDRTGHIVHEIPLTVNNPNSHRDTRLVRKLENGHYLVCHEGDGMVREYDATGKVVWSYTLDLGGRERSAGHDGHGTEVFGAIRLPNGNTLVAGGNNNRVLEVTPRGRVVWEIGQTELPGISLYWVTTLQRLPNGHTIIGNTHAGPDNPQLIEVTRAKKVVWTFKDFVLLGNDCAAAQVLDVKGHVIR